MVLCILWKNGSAHREKYDNSPLPAPPPSISLLRTPLSSFLEATMNKFREVFQLVRCVTHAGRLVKAAVQRNQGSWSCFSLCSNCRNRAGSLKCLVRERSRILFDLKRKEIKKTCDGRNRYGMRRLLTVCFQLKNTLKDFGICIFNLYVL